jgi:hypothetical protein
MMLVGVFTTEGQYRLHNREAWIPHQEQLDTWVDGMDIHCADASLLGACVYLRTISVGGNTNAYMFLLIILSQIYWFPRGSSMQKVAHR